MAELGYEPSFSDCKEVILVKYMMRAVMWCPFFFFFFKGVTEAQRSIPAQAGMGLQRVSGKQELVS